MGLDCDIINKKCFVALKTFAKKKISLKQKTLKFLIDLFMNNSFWIFLFYFVN